MENRLTKPALALLSILVGPTATAGSEMLNDHDSSPLSGLFGLPDSTESASLAGAGHWRLDTIANTASHSVIDAGGNELLALDGETRRIEVNLRYGVNERLEIGVELPYVWHESGSLDSLIDSWHDAFGLPDGFRTRQPVDELQFRYVDRGMERINLEDNSHGLGDIRLIAGFKLSERNNHRYALRAGVKLPTGDSDTLMGSGGTDLSLGLAGEYESWFGLPALSAYFLGSIVHLGEPDLLADRYQDFVGHLAFGAGYAFGDRFEVRAQAALRSALYDSDVQSLGSSAAMLTVGANIKFGRHWRLSLAVAEDIKVKTAPDVAFQLGLHYRAAD